MGYRIEMLVSKRGRIKIWRGVHGNKDMTRKEAISEAAKILRPGSLRIRIRQNKPPKSKGD